MRLSGNRNLTYKIETFLLLKKQACAPNVSTLKAILTKAGAFKMHAAKALCLAFLSVAGVLSSCSNDEEADFSGVKAEMCLLETDLMAKVKSAVTDSDEQLIFSSPVNVKWAEKADSIYRALLYYRMEGGKALPLSAKQVLVLQPRTKEELRKVLDAKDPVTFVSGWKAKNGSFLNLTVDIKTGTQEGSESSHSVALLEDTVCVSPTGKRYCYRLLHSRNGVPEYYTVRTYISIPASQISSGDTISLDIPNYDGMMRKVYIK